MHISKAQSVAVVGASGSPSKVGGRPIKYMLQYNYSGNIYPINPGRETVQGLKAYASLDALPETPDVVVVAVPASEAVAAVDLAATLGVPHVVVFSSGFSEVGPAGKLLEQQLEASISGSKSRLYGPNCQGIVVPAKGLYLTFSSVYWSEPASDGTIAIVSQSGAVAAMVYSVIDGMGGGIRSLAATGNEVDVNTIDILRQILDDPGVHTVALYVEAISDELQALQVIRELTRRGKRLVLLYAGKSSEGQQAAVSHTGSLSSRSDIFEQALAELGVVVAEDVQALAEKAVMSARVEVQPDLRTCVISNSGGLGVTVVDELSQRGFSIPQPTSGLRGRVSEWVPDFITPRNPVDLSTGLQTHPESLGALLVALKESREYDYIICAFGMITEAYDRDLIAEQVASAREAPGTGEIVTAWPGVAQVVIQQIGRENVYSSANIGSTLAVLGDTVLASRGQRQEEIEGLGGDRTHSGTSDQVVLSEHESREVLVDMVDTDNHSRVVENFDAIAGSDIGQWPLVLKVNDDRVVHKSDHGFVKLGVNGWDELQQASSAMRQSFSGLFKDEPQGFLIEEMVGPGYDMFIGVKRDPRVGYVILVGAGGVDVETIRDTVTLLPPLVPSYVEERLKGLRSWDTLVRGRSGPYPYQEFISLICSFDRKKMAEAQVHEIDINPVRLVRGTPTVRILDATVIKEKQ